MTHILERNIAIMHLVLLKYNPPPSTSSYRHLRIIDNKGIIHAFNYESGVIPTLMPNADWRVYNSNGIARNPFALLHHHDGLRPCILQQVQS